jgi:CDP-diacylglycerol--glycerol-3-phosphate 3-phosphatidyltransferase
VQQEGLWIGTAIVSYAASLAAGWRKFRHLPAYHTRAAKTAWLLVLVGVYCMFSNQGVWAIRIAMGAVTLTNIEALLITRVLPEWRADVPSLWHALQIARQHKSVTSSPRHQM